MTSFLPASTETAPRSRATKNDERGNSFSFRYSLLNDNAPDARSLGYHLYAMTDKLSKKRNIIL
jgi:hypothetical protein